MQIYGIFTENRGKYVKNRGKCTENREFPRNPFLEVAEPKGDPAVVFGRFRLFFRSFLDMIPNDSAKSFLFFPFHSSTPYFYALQHIL